MPHDFIEGVPEAPNRLWISQIEPFFIAAPAAGGPLWMASSGPGHTPPQELSLRIPESVESRRQILEALSGPGEKVKLYLTNGPVGRGYDLLCAEPVLSEAQRLVCDEKGHVYTWTRELDDRVDELFQHAIQARVFACQTKLLDDGERFGPIVARARDLFGLHMRALGDTRTTNTLGDLFDHGMGPKLDGTKASYAEALMGRQLTEKGDVEQVYYDASIPLGQQIGRPEEPAAWAAMVANYAMQRAMVDYLRASLGRTGQVREAKAVSFLEWVEGNLVRQRILGGFHPARTSADYFRLAAEFSRRLIAATVQGMVGSLGGHAANQEYDYVTPDEAASPRDEHGRPCTLQSCLYDHAYRSGQIVHYIEHEKARGKPDAYLKKLNMVCREWADDYVAAKEKAVAAAMDRAMASGRTRAADPGEFIKNRLHELAQAEKGLLSIFAEVESMPPDIF